jgi:hypothetical protein
MKVSFREKLSTTTSKMEIGAPMSKEFPALTRKM